METGDFVHYDEKGRAVRRSRSIMENPKYTNRDGSRAFWYAESPRWKPPTPKLSWTPTPAAPKMSAPRVNLRRDFEAEPAATPVTPPAAPVTPRAALPNLRSILILIAITLVAFLLFRMIWNQPPDRYEWIRSTKQDKLPNYALLSKGASIESRYTSQTYLGDGRFWRFVAMISSKYLNVLKQKSPLIPGHCWQFEGSEGQLHIELSRRVPIEYITIGHIVKWQSPTGEVTGAPRFFSVYGMNSLDGGETYLGQYEYNQDGPAFQTFRIDHPHRFLDSFKHVRLRIESNWGNPEYTSLCSVRVHGPPATD